MNPFGYEPTSDARRVVALLSLTPADAFLAGRTNFLDHLTLGVSATP